MREIYDFFFFFTWSVKQVSGHRHCLSETISR